jgi:Protein of unknown function (DUF1641)
MSQEVHMAVNERLSHSSRTDELLARLEEPQTVEALNTVLDHADLLAFLVVGLDGFLTRGEVITDSLASGLGELRGSASGGGALARIDFRGLATSLAALSGPAVAATPALGELLTGPLADPGTVRVLGQLASAVGDGWDRTVAEPGAPTGVFALARSLKDEDVSRGLGLLIQVAKALGRQLRSP